METFRDTVERNSKVMFITRFLDNSPTCDKKWIPNLKTSDGSLVIDSWLKNLSQEAEKKFSSNEPEKRNFTIRLLFSETGCYLLRVSRKRPNNYLEITSNV